MVEARELPDDEVERIADEGSEAGESATSFLTVANPYPAGSAEAEIWAHAYRSAFSRSIDR